MRNEYDCNQMYEKNTTVLTQISDEYDCIQTNETKIRLHSNKWEMNTTVMTQIQKENDCIRTKLSSKNCKKIKQLGGVILAVFSLFKQKCIATRHEEGLVIWQWCNDIHKPTTYLWTHISTTLWSSCTSETDFRSIDEFLFYFKHCFFVEFGWLLRGYASDCVSAQ